MAKRVVGQHDDPECFFAVGAHPQGSFCLHDAGAERVCREELFAQQQVRAGGPVAIQLTFCHYPTWVPDVLEKVATDQ